MYLPQNNFYKIILILIGILVIIAGVSIFFVPPAIYPDPSWGFLVMRSMQMGAGFNLMVSPNPADISKNLAAFLSWWAPGQYLAPYFFKLLLNVNTGQASAITVTISSLLGLSGFYLFFKKIGFAKIIAAASLVFIICQHAFWTPFAFYNGGEILLFAFEGWFLYGCVLLEKTNFKLFAFVLLSGWIGFFCKSSFIWIYVAGLLCLWVRLSANKPNPLAWIKKALWLAVPAIISLAAIYFFYLSKGENPVSKSNGFMLAWQTFGFPMASPLLAGFSVDDLLNGLIFHSGVQIVPPAMAIAVLLLLAILSLLLVAAILFFVPNNSYRLFIIVFYIISILFFGYSFLRQANISYEARHFRIIGLLIVPGIIYMVSRLKIYRQVAFLLLCVFIAHKSKQFIVAMHRGNMEDAHGISGISQPFIDQPSLNHISRLDKQNTNAIFVFTTPDVSLEIQHNRTITLVDDMPAYLGHAGPLYILLPKNYSRVKEGLILQCFTGYKKFSVTPLSNNYTLYSAY